LDAQLIVGAELGEKFSCLDFRDGALGLVGGLGGDLAGRGFGFFGGGLGGFLSLRGRFFGGGFGLRGDFFGGFLGRLSCRCGGVFRGLRYPLDRFAGRRRLGFIGP
jgi:hypothetical protein